MSTNLTGLPPDMLLLGVVGSRAYGLAREDSDTDRLGVFVLPTVSFHGLRVPSVRSLSRNTTGPDVTLHEAVKFVTLCLSCNPSATELLWLPEEFYEFTSSEGQQLIGLRDRFLSAERVEDAYLGYADQQFKRLISKGRFPDVPVSRIAKHARHLYRLVEQGISLWLTGVLHVRVESPERCLDFGVRVSEGDVSLAEEKLLRAREIFKRYPSRLPSSADEAAVESWLLAVRASRYDSPDLVGRRTIEGWCDGRTALDR